MGTGHSRRDVKYFDPALKHFVYDYYAQLDGPRVAAVRPPVAVVATK
jgi:hypothetical protein